MGDADGNWWSCVSLIASWNVRLFQLQENKLSGGGRGQISVRGRYNRTWLTSFRTKRFHPADSKSEKVRQWDIGQFWQNIEGWNEWMKIWIGSKVIIPLTAISTFFLCGYYVYQSSLRSIFLSACYLYSSIFHQFSTYILFFSTNISPTPLAFPVFYTPPAHF